MCDLIGVTWLWLSETVKHARGDGCKRRRGWNWTAQQQGIPETSDNLLSRTSRAVTSAFPTTVRLPVCSFGFTQLVALLSMGYLMPAWSWENI